MHVGVSRPGELLEHLHAVHHLACAGRILVEKIGQRLDRRGTSFRTADGAIIGFLAK